MVTQSRCQDYSYLIPNELKLNTIVIDAGHGGHDLGAVGGRFKEKDITLQIALRLQAELSRRYPSLQIYQTRTRDQFIGLEERKNIARQYNADLFISIHCNTGDKNQYGASILYPGMHSREKIEKEAIRENNSILLEDDYHSQYQGFDPSLSHSYSQYAFPIQARNYQSKQFANHLATAFRANQRVGSVNQAGLIILNRNLFPSVLVQVGNIVNRNDENYLSAAGIQSTVNYLVQGISAYKAQLDAEGQKILDAKRAEIERLEAERKRKEAEEAEARRIAEEERKRKEESNWSWPSVRTLDMEGTKYLIQLVIEKNYDKTDFPFENIVMSRIDVIDSYKYLIGPYDSKEEAQNIHKQAQEKGFRNAFLLTYENGKIVR